MDIYEEGLRHQPCSWPSSRITGGQHKLVLPHIAQDQKFVLVIGDSHLRSLVDGIVTTPSGCLSFGYLCNPGASALDLQREVMGAAIPEDPDIVCLLAPSNNLTTSRTIEGAAKDFKLLLQAILYRWPKAFVLDFPPRLTVDWSHQEMLRNEYHRTAACLSVPYKEIVGYFPTKALDQWSKDGVHLSDNVGMPMLAQIIWCYACMQLYVPSTNGPTLQTPPPAPPNRFIPTLVVKGEVKIPAGKDPMQWAEVHKGRVRRTEADVQFQEFRRVDMGFGISIVKEKSLMINHSSFKRMTRDLMEVLFSREEMAVSSVSGRKSNINPDTAAKSALTKSKVLAIIAYVQKHFPGTDKASINTAMAYKLKDVVTEEM